MKDYLKIAGNIHLSYYVEASDILGINYEIVLPYLMAKFWNNEKTWYIINTVTPLINAPSATIAKRKNLTNLILSKANFPVPKQENLTTPQEAISFWKKNENIVIKPLQALGGKGVTILPETEDDVLKAFSYASVNTKSKGKFKVLGEQFIQGRHYRLLVLENKVIGAVNRRPASIKGDGVSSISQLIDRLNIDRKNRLLMPIPVDDQTKKRLKMEGLTLDSIPQKDQYIETRLNANMTSGGTTRECINEINPYYLDLAVKAVHEIGLIFGGVDLIAEDITNPSAPHAINEINYNPGLRLHYKPDDGNIVKVAIPIMEYISTH